ncbi:MAG: HD domain-containing protein [Clostridiales bacterium]|nr:HD domain-containing protein [Clostridiales bacterium]
MDINMKENTVRILLVEDNDDDAELVELELGRVKMAYQLKRVESRNDFLNMLEFFRPDLIISDYQLPAFDGRSALKLTQELARDIPFILVTGSKNEEVAIECIRNGARDYVIKEHLDRLGLAVLSAIEHKRAIEELNLSYKKLQHNFILIVETMSRIIELRDPYTAGHQRRVSRLAVRIGEEIGLNGYELEGLMMAGMIHDIGKMSVPSEILCKPGRLNEPEMALIRMHPEAGAGIVRPVDFPWPVADIIAQHHEKMDGSGYGKGISGSGILKEARILCVADVVEAIASHRPYRNALGLEAAMEQIRSKKGELYDPEIASCCIDLFYKEKFKFEE